MTARNRLSRLLVPGLMALVIAAQAPSTSAAPTTAEPRNPIPLPWQVEDFRHYLELFGVKNDDGSLSAECIETEFPIEEVDGILQTGRSDCDEIVLFDPNFEPGRIRASRAEIRNARIELNEGIEVTFKLSFLDDPDIRKTSSSAVDLRFGALGLVDTELFQNEDLLASAARLVVHARGTDASRSDRYDVTGIRMTAALSRMLGFIALFRLENHLFDAVIHADHDAARKTFSRKGSVTTAGLEIGFELTVGNVPDTYVSLSNGPELPPDTTILKVALHIEDKGFVPAMIEDLAATDGVSSEWMRTFLLEVSKGALLAVDDAAIRAQLAAAIEDLMTGNSTLSLEMTPKAALTFSGAGKAITNGAIWLDLMDISVDTRDRAVQGTPNPARE